MEIFVMTDQNSSPSDQIRPEDLMGELGIKKDTYYADLNHLGIKAAKNKNGKAYLTNEQANLVRQLRSHVSETGKREGFTSDITGDITGDISDDKKGDLVHTETNNGITYTAEATELEIPENESTLGQELDSNHLEQLINEAAALKMQNLAAPHLIKLHLADQMTEEDLPPQMREKVVAVREAANPKKFQPAMTASNLLTQWRSRRGNS